MRSKYLELHEKLVNHIDIGEENGQASGILWQNVLEAQIRLLEKMPELDLSLDDFPIPTYAKRCTGPCKRVLQKTGKNFRKDKRNRDGLQSQCKQCKSKKHKREKNSLTVLADIALDQVVYHVPQVEEGEDIELLLKQEGVCGVIVKLKDDKWKALERSILGESGHMRCHVAIQGPKERVPKTLVRLDKQLFAKKLLEHDYNANILDLLDELKKATSHNSHIQSMVAELNDAIYKDMEAQEANSQSLLSHLNELDKALHKSPNLPLYQRDFALEKNLPESHALWSTLFDPIMGVATVERNVLLLLKPEHAPKIHYQDKRDCFYLTVYYYLGGQATFAALHQDTLGIPAGNVVLRGRKQWHFICGSLERIMGARRLLTDLSVPQVKWLQKQPGIQVVTVNVDPGQLMVVNNNVPHMVVNTGRPTASVAWNVSRPCDLQMAWDKMQKNRKYGIASKILLQELIWRAMHYGVKEANPLFQEMYQAQKVLFQASDIKHVYAPLQPHQFEWCDLCAGEIWNAHVNCGNCQLDVCAFCYTAMPHEHKGACTLYYHVTHEEMTNVLVGN